MNIITAVYNFLWGDLITLPLPGGSSIGISLLVLLLVPAGIYFTIRTRFVLIRRFPHMIQIAMEKNAEDGQEILYLLQDMREFELYGTVRAVVSICDSMNYITEKEDLLEVFRLVNNYLDPKGIFIFDLNTFYKYREILGEQTIAEDREDASFIWDNYFDEEENINEYDLSLFIPEEHGGEILYRKYEEVHYQKAYTLEEIRQLIEASGMKFLAAYDAFTHDPVKEDSERVYILAQENGK